MSKKNMDALLSNIMGEAIERPTDITVAETTQPDKAPLSSKEKKERCTFKTLHFYLFH